MDVIDLYRSAKLNIDQDGTDASAHAVMRAEALLACDDPDGFNVWMRIGRAIEDMQATEGGTTPTHSRPTNLFLEQILEGGKVQCYET